MKTKQLKEQAERILTAIEEIERSLERNLIGAELDLTRPQLRTLISVARNNHCPMSKLGNLTGYPTSALTGIIDRMIIKKLVRRVRDENDRRIVKVEATANGLKLAGQSYRIILSNTRAILQKVDQNEREKIVSLVEKIADSFALKESKRG